MNWGKVRSMDFSIYNIRRRVDEYYHLFEGKHKSHNNEQNMFRFSSVSGVSSFIIDTDFFHIEMRSDSDNPFDKDMKAYIEGTFYKMLYLKKNGNYIDVENDFFLSDLRMIDKPEYKLINVFKNEGTSLNYVDYVRGNNKSTSILLGFRLEGSPERIDSSISFLPIRLPEGRECKICLRIEER